MHASSELPGSWQAGSLRVLRRQHFLLWAWCQRDAAPQGATCRGRECTGPVRIAVVVVVNQVCLGSLIDDDVQQRSSADGARPGERGPKRTAHHGLLCSSLSPTLVSSSGRLAIDMSGRFNPAPGGLQPQAHDTSRAETLRQQIRCEVDRSPGMVNAGPVAGSS